MNTGTCRQARTLNFSNISFDISLYFIPIVAPHQKVTGSKSYWIVGAGLGVASLVVILAISLIVIYHYRRKTAKKLPAASEAV